MRRGLFADCATRPSALLSPPAARIAQQFRRGSAGTWAAMTHASNGAATAPQTGERRMAKTRTETNDLARSAQTSNAEMAADELERVVGGAGGVPGSSLGPVGGGGVPGSPIAGGGDPGDPAQPVGASAMMLKPSEPINGAIL